MSEEILHNEDKETLRRRLEHLKREYERTAQRLQRAEHHDATCRRVQNRDSDHTTFTQIDFSHTSESSIETSSMPTPEYSENHQNLQLQTNIVAGRNSSGFSTVQKIPAIQLQLAEIASTPPLCSPACRRSPAHRLRSKRSRLRLQNKERESDTDISQEKERDRRGDHIHEKGSECTDKENGWKGVRNEDCEKKKERKIKMMPAEGEKNQDRPIGVRTDCKIAKASQELEDDVKREGHCELNSSVIQSDYKLLMISSIENHLEIQNIHCSQEEVNVPLIDRPVEKKIQSSSAVSIQTSSFPQASEAVQITDKSEEMLKQTNQSFTDTNKDYDDRIDIKHSSFSSGILDSCTLVEGLPFPVEYYIRTTRRMAASHSSIDLDAVIYSQLTGGRGRRRLSQSQVSGRGHVTPERSESVCKSTDQVRRRGRGRRGRRGHRRSTVCRPSCAKAALDITISNPASDSQADSESLIESKSDTESLSLSELVLEQPQVESRPIQSPGPIVSLKTSPEQGVTQDFKHLPDSQLYFDSQLLVDSDLYQARCRGKGQRGRRGRRRSTIGRSACATAALDCTISHPANDSQADSESLIESKSDTESPSQSQLVLERPQTKSWLIQSPGPTVNLKTSPEQGVTQDFKQLPDSQLYFDSQLLVDSDLYQARCRGKGQRGRRGRRRSTICRSSCAKAALDCTISHPASDSQADSESLIESKSDTESPSQSQLVLERPQTKSCLIQSPGPTVNLKTSPEQGVTQDFKHLPDSQLYFDSQLLPGSNLYPIFRRKRGQTGREFQTSSNKDDQSPLLPSLASLIQALQEKDMKARLLAAVDIQDFHLPDEDFGQLKLKLLRSSASAVEPFAQRPLVYNTRQRSRCQRVSGRISNCEVRYLESELFTPEPLTTSSHEDSLPLCQPDPTDQSQTEIQKGLNVVNEIKTISSDLMDSRQFFQTETDKGISNEKRVKSSESENISELHINQMLKESHMLSENTSLCPEILNLSPSLTPQIQKGQDPLLPSLGMSPHFLIPGSPIDLRSPLFSSSGVLRSPSSVSLKGCVSPESVSAKTSGNIKNGFFTRSGDQGGSETQNQTQMSQETMTKVQKNVKPGTPSHNNTTLEYENLNGPERESSCISEKELERECGFDTESNLECGNKIKCTPENEVQLHNIPEPGSFKNLSESEIQTQNDFEMEIQTYKRPELRLEIQSNATNVKQFESGNVCQTPVETISLDTSTNRRTETTTVSGNNRTQSEERNTDESNNRTLHEETPTATSFSDAAGCSAVLQEIHTFKALEGGCVLDLCLVRWPSEDWCICVAGEWSVCLWAQMKGVQPWSLLHTWTFAQPVMSLQEIPDSSGLLCVTLGHLEITEARVLCCPSLDGTFSQNVVCKDTLQAVVGVSNCRLVCCSTPGDQQRVNVLTVTQEGRVVNTLPFVSAKQNIRTLAVVEGEKDALIGWTECRTLLIWSINSGQLLQTINLEKTLTMTNCMKGYSYRGVLCALLQNAGNVCDEKSNASLFTLIATNPLTGKHITLTSINYPDQHKQQLIDGDVLGSGLVGVFQSGHLAVWDLRGSVAKVVVVLDELCRLARWAGPNTLLTGYLNGDVSVFHYKST
ncbi:uncharacterized protein palb2 [Rhinichthys klamathensis goyatoka]|uniref:uncharacterized protein palb2 n=1 Tax=Rhinichthys klamathensis goyatoka TaxID=3034132 RepID=UPI0024B4AB89|nr:uncharacterized protein palb2 [Rhinichthys klamathensis goyatoka]XP_056119523.1 uncharacterized protein palb2 [Rhinichthys klamathensis goyatoka]